MRYLSAAMLFLVLVASCRSNNPRPDASAPGPAAQPTRATARQSIATRSSAAQPGISLPATSEIADLERKIEEIRGRMAPGKATDLQLQDALISLDEARLRHAVVIGQRQQALQAMDAIVQACGQKVQIVQERQRVGKASERELLEATRAQYETQMRRAILRNQPREASEAADGAVRTQQQNVDDLRELLRIGKATAEESAVATQRLEEWRALRRQQALVVEAQDRLDGLIGQPGGQTDINAVEGAKADLTAARRQVYTLASLLMPAASDLLAGAVAGHGPLAGQDASRPAASQPAEDEPLTRDEMMAAQRKPYEVPGQRCNLVWRDFPAGFADYFCIQGTGYAVVPNPKPDFCKSDKPLLFHAPKGTITSAMLLDRSQPGGPYDTLYVDFNDNGDFQDDPVYHAQPYRGVAPDGGVVHAYFTNVQIMHVPARNISAHVQIFLKDATWDTKGEPPYTICAIPQRWAVGTVRLKDRTAPAAVFDRNWNDSAIDQVGLNLSEYKDRYPRGDYLYLDPDGGQELRPGSLGNGPDNGSPHTILNEYLQIGEDTYKVKAAQSGDGVQLDLTPVQVPMGKIRVHMMYPGGRVVGLKTSLLLRGEPNPINAIPVPADTYAFFGMDNALGEPVTVEPDQTVDLPKSAQRPAPAPVRTLSAGQAAPPFETRTLDGKPLNLADYRGKVVLLDFWATWCGPCVKEIPNLKALCDRFGKNDRFAMISLSIDDDAETVQSFLKKQPMPWVQGFLDDKDRAQITEKCGVAAIPATFLIGPDGIILATDLRGEKIAEAVAKALGEGTASPDVPASQANPAGSAAK